MIIASRLLMLLSVLLFVIAVIGALIVFLNRMGFIKTKLSSIKSKHIPVNIRTNYIFIIILYFLLTRLIIYATGYVGYMLVKNEYIDFLNSFSNLFVKWDAEHYIFIAENWYVNFGDKKNLLVFFPLYPMVIRLFSIVFRNYIAAGVFVSNISLIIGCIYLHKLTELDFDSDTALRAVRYLLIFPVSFFFSSTFSESFFLALTLSALYYFRKKSYTASGILAFMAALTRSFGILLIVPMISNLFTEWKTVRPNKSELTGRIFNIVTPFLGTFTYLLVNIQVSGNAFTFLKYQKEHWNQTFGFFGSTISMIVSNSFIDKASQSASLWIPQLIVIFAALIILCFSVRKLEISYVAYMIVYIFMTISPTWLLSAPRYLMCLFPLFITLAYYGNNRHLDYAVTVLMATGLGFCTIAFANGYYIM